MCIQKINPHKATNCKKKYKITDKNTKKTLYALEYKPLYAPVDYRPFSITFNIVNCYNKPVIDIKVPTYESCSWFMPCCSQSMVTFTKDDDLVGCVKQKWNSKLPNLDVENQYGEVMMNIEGPVFQKQGKKGWKCIHKGCNTENCTGLSRSNIERNTAIERNIGMEKNYRNEKNIGLIQREIGIGPSATRQSNTYLAKSTGTKACESTIVKSFESPSKSVINITFTGDKSAQKKALMLTAGLLIDYLGQLNIS